MTQVEVETKVPLTDKQKKHIQDAVVDYNKKSAIKKVRLPERIENISLKWLRDAPFYSEFLLRFNYYETEGMPTMGVNSTKGRINLYYNPKFMNGGALRPKFDKDGKPKIRTKRDGTPILDPFGNVQYKTKKSKPLSDLELEGVLIHEIMHLVHFHHERSLEDHYVYNIAGDMLINNDIRSLSIGGRKVDLPEGVVYIDEAIKEGYKGEEVTEPLYYWLLKEQEKYQKMAEKMVGQGGGEGQEECSECGGSGKETDEDGNETGEKCKHCNGSGKEPGEGQGKELSDTLFGNKYASKIDDHSKMEENDELAEGTVKEVVNTAKIRGWGNISGNMVEKLEKLTSPRRIPWRSILRKFVSNMVFQTGAIYENSWSRRNRRGLPLPGIKKLSNKIILAIDTSGSISQHQLQAFFAEIEVIVKDFGQIELLQWDTNVVNASDNYKRGDWSRIDVCGRGGTDPQCVWEWMVENKMNMFPVVMFTDGYFSYEHLNNYGIKTLWCVTNEDQVVPHGRNIFIDLSEE